MKNRFGELDSLRGLAAFSVMMLHVFTTLPVFSVALASAYSLWIVNTPLSAIWAGHSAVIFFFVLSGFVLTLSFLDGKKLSYTRFLFKRCCRIYIPYLFVVTSAVLLKVATYHSGVTGVSKWFHKFWTIAPTAPVLLEHFLLIVPFKTDAFDFVIWSLQHEMRISIIFPFVVVGFAVRYKWRASLLLALFLSLLSAFLFFVESFHGHPPTSSSFVYTLHYVGMFMVGSLIAIYKESILQAYRDRSRMFKLTCLAVALLTYTYPFWFLPGHIDVHFYLIEDWVITFGAALFMIASLGSAKVSSLVLLPPIRFLGKISYSLYLVHPVVLLTLIYTLGGRLPLWLLLITVPFLSITIAFIVYQFVEVPSIKLGRMTFKRSLPQTDPQVSA